MIRQILSGRAVSFVVAACLCPLFAFGQYDFPTTFTYQGKLEEAGVPVDRPVKLLVNAYSSASGGTSLEAVFTDEVEVNDGLFTAELTFSPETLAVQPLYLNFAISEVDESVYVFLNGRQRVTPAPAATQASGAAIDEAGNVLLRSFVGTRVVAQSGTSNATTTVSDFWQSFTASASGEIQGFSFEVTPRTDGTFPDGFLYEGEGINGPLLATDTGGSTPAQDTIGYAVRTLAEGVQIEAGKVYTVRMQSASTAFDWELDTNNPYAGGRSSFDSRFDYKFQVFIEAPGTPSAFVEPNGSIVGRNVRAVSTFPRLEALSTSSSASLRLATGVDNGDPFDDAAWSLIGAEDSLSLSYSLNNITRFRPFYIDAVDEEIGVNELTALAKLHVTNREVSQDIGGLLFEDDLIVEDEDAVLGLYSDTEGTWGSGIKLGQVDGAAGDTWSIVRESNTTGNDLAFLWSTGGDYSAATRLFSFQNNGDMGIGADPPEADLHIRSALNPTLKIQSDGNAEESGRLSLRQANNSGVDFVYQGQSGVERMIIQLYASGSTQTNAYMVMSNLSATLGYVGMGELTPAYRLELPNIAGTGGRGRANAWVTYSSERYKEHVEPIEEPLDLVGKLRGVRFDWKQDFGAGADLGFIAEEVAEVFPELVQLDEDGRAQSLDYSRLVPVAVEAIKAQQATIDAQQAEIQAQRKRLESLEQAVAELLGSGD